jgi:hypothetical protein
MNEIYLNFAASAALGIALCVIKPLTKTPKTWMITTFAFAIITIILTTIAFPLPELQPSEQLTLFAGNLIGTLIFLIFGSPTTTLPKIIAFVIILAGGGLALTATLNHLIQDETERLLPSDVEETLIEAFEYKLQKNLYAKIIKIDPENPSNIKKESGEFQTPTTGNPALFIIENFAEDLVANKHIGPLYIAEIKGIPTIETVTSSQHIDHTNTEIETLIARGSVTLHIKLIPVYYKDDQLLHDPAITESIKVPLAAIIEDSGKMNIISIIFKNP